MSCISLQLRNQGINTIIARLLQGSQAYSSSDSSSPSRPSTVSSPVSVGCAVLVRCRLRGRNLMCRRCLQDRHLFRREQRQNTVLCAVRRLCTTRRMSCFVLASAMVRFTVTVLVSLLFSSRTYYNNHNVNLSLSCGHSTPQKSCHDKEL